MVDLSHNAFGRAKGKAADDAAKAFVARRLKAITNAKPVALPPMAARSDRRKDSARQSVFRLARLFTSRFDSVRCVVVDLSADGARVAMEGAYTLPEEVTLSFDQSCVKRKARIAWRHDRELGLEFIKDEKPEKPEDDQDYGDFHYYD